MTPWRFWPGARGTWREVRSCQRQESTKGFWAVAAGAVGTAQMAYLPVLRLGKRKVPLEAVTAWRRRPWVKIVTVASTGRLDSSRTEPEREAEKGAAATDDRVGDWAYAMGMRVASVSTRDVGLICIVFSVRIRSSGQGSTLNAVLDNIGRPPDHIVMQRAGHWCAQPRGDRITLPLGFARDAAIFRYHCFGPRLPGCSTAFRLRRRVNQDDFAPPFRQQRRRKRRFVVSRQLPLGPGCNPGVQRRIADCEPLIG